jgi:hypothetical protein
MQVQAQYQDELNHNKNINKQQNNERFQLYIVVQQRNVINLQQFLYPDILIFLIKKDKYKIKFIIHKRNSIE